MSAIQSLGYLGLEVSDLDAWRKFAADVLGLEVEAHEKGALRLRSDDRALRIVAYKGAADDLGFAGFEVADENALEAEVKRLKAAGVELAPGSDEEARFRCVKKFYRFKDKDGTPLEIFCGAQKAEKAFASTKIVSEFMAGKEGIGGITLFVRDVKTAEEFYSGLLGLKLRDRVIEKTQNGSHEIAFLYMNERHHSVALSTQAGNAKKLERITLQTNHIDDVGFGFDRVRDTKTTVVGTMGVNLNDHLLSFLSGSPSGFIVEFATGARQTPMKWENRVYPSRTDWGHRPPERSEIAQGWERQKMIQERRAAKAAALAAAEKQPQNH